MHGTTLHSLEQLRTEYEQLRRGKDALLTLIEEAELPESVYNSNAIENSTLTLDETEKILLHQMIPPHHSKREIFEAINLGQVTEYLNAKILQHAPLTEELILSIHRTLLSHIRDDVAGRYRQEKEYVRVGLHIAPPPARVPSLITEALSEYHDERIHILDRVITFHLAFEHIHPFIDGNGRVGRALLNFQLKMHGYPPIIIRNKEKRDYYLALQEYDQNQSPKDFERIIALQLKESFHKRIAYLRGEEIIALSDAAKTQTEHSPQAIANAAKKQSLPAFRERGRWKVEKAMFGEWNTRSEKSAP